VMTPRERFKAVIHFRKPDELPWCELLEDETVMRWIDEGLPLNTLLTPEWVFKEGGPLTTFASLKINAYPYFGCQNLFNGCSVPIDLGPIPRYTHRILREDARYQERLTSLGATIRRSKHAKYTVYSMPMFVEFPVKDRKTWEECQNRLDPETPGRYPKEWQDEAYAKVFENYQAGPTNMWVSGFYGFGAQLMGIPAFITGFYRDPELMREMASHWEHYTLEIIRDAVETLKDRIDFVFWWEDLAEKHGPNISPKIYKEFFLPHYKNVTALLKKNGIDRIMMDSDGNTNALLDMVIEAGITGHWPLEANSGMDALTLRKKYGERLFLAGNLDKRELMKGGEAMRIEVSSKLPTLKESGGYIPTMDHGVPSEFSLKNFMEYAEYMKKQLPY